MPVSMGKIKSVVTLVVSGAMTLGVIGIGFAQEANDADLGALLRENRIAKIVYDLNLTADQRAELKAIVDRIQAARAARRDELIGLLAERRDALLAGDREALEATRERLAALGNPLSEELKTEIAAFADGLTERQQRLVARLLVRGLEPTESRGPGSRPAAPGERVLEPRGRVGIGLGWAAPMAPGRPGDRRDVQGRISRGEGMMDRGHRVFMRHREVPGGLGPMVGAEHLDTLLDLLD